MPPLSLTAAARRVLDHTVQRAQREDRPADERHLIVALLQVDSQAGEVLESCGVTLDTLAADGVLDEATLRIGEADEDSHAAETRRKSTAIDSWPHTRGLRRVLDHARATAVHDDGESEVGTLHLLRGLVSGETDMGAVLIAREVHLHPLIGGGSREDSPALPPLAIDVTLEFPERPPYERIDALRIIDAAANRGREGLRVLEDYVRFEGDDGQLAALLKQLRHDLAGLLAQFDESELLRARDTPGDVGTEITTEAESRRGTPLDVVKAAGKRVQEALRSLEEFSKVVRPEVSEALGQLRYRLYTIEKSLLLTARANLTFESRNLYLLVSAEACRIGFERTVKEALRGGVGVVQLREKRLNDREIMQHAADLRRWTREAGALFIMNDRPDLAVLSDADGVHVGQEELTVRQARRVMGPDRLVGVSTHSLDQAEQAVIDGADYLGVGPVFSSGTKTFEEFAGVEYVRAVAGRNIRRPWFAIGGLTPENVAEAVMAGAQRIAVSGAICGAENPWQATRRLIERLEAGGSGDSD